MKKNIKCLYEYKISKQPGDSSYFPSLLRNKDNVHRLKINGSPGEFEHLLANLQWPGYQWLAFLSSPMRDDEIPPNAVDCPLSWIQRTNLDSLCFDRLLYYVVGNSAQIVEQVIQSSLWSLGAGIALPIQHPPEMILKDAIKIQLKLKHKLTNAVIDDFGCVIFAEPDNFGVNIIWSEEWEHAKELSILADNIVQEYEEK